MQDRDDSSPEALGGYAIYVYESKGTKIFLQGDRSSDAQKSFACIPRNLAAGVATRHLQLGLIDACRM